MSSTASKGETNAAGVAPTVVQNCSNADVLLKILDEEGNCLISIPTQRTVLMENSEYFEKLLGDTWSTNDGIEADEDNKRIVSLVGDKPVALLLLIQTFARDDKQPTNSYDALLLVGIASKYLCPAVLTASTACLTTTLNYFNCIQIYHEAQKYQQRSLSEFARKTIVAHAGTIVNLELYMDFTTEDWQHFLSLDEFVAAEDNIFNAVLKWGLAQAKEFMAFSPIIPGVSNRLRNLLAPIIPHVRFPLMSLIQFATQVIPTKLVAYDQVSLILKWIELQSAAQPYKPNCHPTVNTNFPQMYAVRQKLLYCIRPRELPRK